MIRSRTNLYQGINAHFQSYAQQERDGWTSFHAAHIVHLVEAIDRLLPPGYEVLAERSLQVRLHNPTTGEVVRRYPQPDVTIWGPYNRPNNTSESNLISVPTLTKPLLETMTEDPDELMNAVVIKELLPDGEAIPVTRIELLSPSNKVGEERIRYLAKRDATLESGTVLVELDYLHQTDAVVRGIAGYVSRQAGAYPFTILVSDPHPSLEAGKTYIFGFHVDDPIPVVDIPLANDEHIHLDFGAVYNHTFESNSAYAKRATYDREPVMFESFDRADQHRIWQCMLRVLEAEREGRDLSQISLTDSTSSPALLEVSQTDYIQATLMIDDALSPHWLVNVVANSHDHRLILKEQNGTTQDIFTGSATDASQHYHRLKGIFNDEGWTACGASMQALRT